MKMTDTDTIAVVSFRKSCEDVSAANDCYKSDDTNGDITKEAQANVNQLLLQEPIQINNIGQARNAIVVTQDGSEGKDLAVNSNDLSADRSTKAADELDETRNTTNDNLKRQSFYFKRSRGNLLAKSLIKRSIKCLNKMHVMEDVHEGCDAQPSSPGHAEQRPEISDMMHLCVENCILKKETEVVSSTLSDAEKRTIAGIKIETPDENQVQIKLENAEKSDEPGTNHVNEDSGSSDSNADSGSLKRKLEFELTEDSPAKKLQLELQRNFLIRDKFLNRYMESLGCNSLDQIQSNTEKILIEVRTLNELAREKEKEWNNIIHLKKIKEELLIRLQRQKQLLLLNNDDFELQSETSEDQSRTTKQPQTYTNRNNKFLFYNKQKNYNGKSIQYGYETNGQGDYNRQNKQRPTLDVKSIIADYRQRHPEAVPRRGRRIRSVLSRNDTNESISRIGSGGVLNLSNIALGSGAQVRQNTIGIDINRELGLLLSSVDEAQKAGCGDTLATMNTDPTSFKDMLVQFAKLSQNERQELLHHAVKPPPPYPEVTLHPVPTTTTSSNSLLHGILTKNQSKPESKSTFSPTLARLLTAPEKSSVVTPQASVAQATTMLQGGVVSISDILSSSKARNEITITPVGGQYDLPVKIKQQMEEDEAEDSVDRLVIDEGGIDCRSKADNNSDAGDEVPQCQGCNQKPAQFVCAGCGNQWYCSRDCQVSAWDEHSEVCSG